MGGEMTSAHLETVQNTSPDKHQKWTGFLPEQAAQLVSAGIQTVRPVSLEWISDELLAHTVDVWSKELGRSVSEDEAIEMPLNVKRLSETLLAIARTEG